MTQCKYQRSSRAPNAAVGLRRICRLTRASIFLAAHRARPCSDPSRETAVSSVRTATESVRRMPPNGVGHDVWRLAQRSSHSNGGPRHLCTTTLLLDLRTVSRIIARIGLVYGNRPRVNVTCGIELGAR